jgi:hypothetical protein
MIGVAVAWLCWLPAAAAAQGTASLTGSVMDESKAVLPGATVTATEASTGRQYVAITDEQGEYRLPSVLPGTYRVQAELSGFATVVVPSVELLVGRSVALPFSLRVATLQETLTVVAEAPLITTRSAAVSGNIDRRQMEELPILGRNWLEMSLLVKGITANTMAGNRAGAARDDQFQLNVDGQQITQGISTSDTFGQPRISREAIAEYELSTSGYDVAQGRSVGIQVQAISRSGTNDVRGAVYGNFRDDSLNAKDFVAQRVLPYSNTQAGFSLGGPIVRNTLHYFGSYEYEREPNTAFVNPQVWANAAVSNITFATKQRQHLALVRGDYQMDPEDRVSMRATWWDSDVPFGGLGAGSYPTAAARSTRYNLSVNGNWSRVLSSRAVQEIRIGYTSYAFANQLGEGVPLTPVYRQAGFPDIGGTNFYPQTFYQRTPSFRYDLNMHAGTHDFKMGGEFLRRRDGADWPNNTRGIFGIQGQTAAEWARRFPLDAWNNPSRWDLSGMNVTQFNISFANDYLLDIPRDTYALWFGDTWRVNDKLTLNYGVRYDLDLGAMDVPGAIETPVLVSNGRDVNLDAGTHPGMRELTDFAPRVGVAYRIDDTLVIRGGAGLFYNYQESNLLTGFQQQITNERRFITVDIFNTTGRADFITNPLGGTTVQQYLSGAVPIPPAALRNLSQDYRNPRTFQANLGYQKQLGPVFGFDSDLLYNKGSNLGFDREVNVQYDAVTGFPKNINFPTTNANPRPNQQYASIRYFESTLESEYLSLANSFTRRMRNRWQAGGTYTRMFFNRDHGTNGFGYLATGNNPFCQTCEWGTAATYQRHTVRLNAIYDAPWGISVAAIYAFGSGTRSGTTYTNQVVSPVQTAGGFFGANRYVTGAAFTIPDSVVYPDGSTHSNYERLVDGTPTSYATGQQVPRNAFQGLPIHRFDLRLSKTVSIPGTPIRITGMLEAFNLFNRTNWGAYNTAVNLPTFGRPSSAFQPRTGQLAFRVAF